MELALIFSAALMGLAGAPHCLAMCGGMSAGVIQSCGRVQPNVATLAFHLGRLISYAAGGAVAAASVALLRTLGESEPWLRPLWTLLHLAALGFGVWLLWTGRQPEWMQGKGRALPPEMAAVGWQRVQGPLRAGATGSLWVAWPCGLLQSALIVATLGSSAWSGAAVMAAFAITSSMGLLVGPALWVRLAGNGSLSLTAGTWAIRVAGAALALASTWALTHGLWQRAWAFCFGP